MSDDRLFWGYFLEVYESAERANWFIGLFSDDEEDELTSFERRLVVMQFDPSGVLRRQRRRRLALDSVPSQEFAAVSDRWRREAEGNAGCSTSLLTKSATDEKRCRSGERRNGGRARGARRCKYVRS